MCVFNNRPCSFKMDIQSEYHEKDEMKKIIPKCNSINEIFIVEFFSLLFITELTVLWFNIVFSPIMHRKVLFV
jgi:hypothetical protein